nr:hypothetical protein BaRGS_029370 [Batillaria attramentaria]
MQEKTSMIADNSARLVMNVHKGKTKVIKNPHGKRKRGRPRNTWRRDLEADAKSVGHSWGQLERLAQDRRPGELLSAAYAPEGGQKARVSE